MKGILRNAAAAGLGIAFLSSTLCFSSVPAAAASVTINVNGSTVSFDQPPIERGGRVFVPLRGVFEHLGASVVYANRVINASGNGHNVSLRIGSTTATVDGQSVMMDVAPFLVGARTLVPLRFVSQALGASVNYNNGTRVVDINMAGAPVGNNPPPPSSNSCVTLQNASPANNGVTASNNPTIGATFSQAVDPNSVRFTLDSRDLTTGAYVSGNEFYFTPGYALPAGRHTVTVRGTCAAGGTFTQTFAFTTGANVQNNFITLTSPANGQQISGPFTISGTTLPNSHVRIVAQGANAIFGIFRATTGTFTVEINADASGLFSQTINPSDLGNPSNIAIQVTSTEPTTQASAQQTLQVHV